MALLITCRPAAVAADECIEVWVHPVSAIAFIQWIAGAGDPAGRVERAGQRPISTTGPIFGSMGNVLHGICVIAETRGPVGDFLYRKLQVAKLLYAETNRVAERVEELNYFAVMHDG